jgi:hypothetical protein
MFDKLIELLNELLPDSELPTKDYIARVIVNFFLVITLLLGLYFIIENTILADRIGLSKVTKANQVLTHVDLIRDTQATRQIIKQFSDVYTDIRLSFIILLTDDSGNIITKPTADDKVKTLIWTIINYSGGEDSLYVLDEAVSKFNKTLIKELKTGGCVSNKITGTTIEKNRALSASNITHYVSCPIYSKKTELMLGYTLIFLSVNASMPVASGNLKSKDADILTIWTYEDRLLRITKLIVPYFRDFENKYTFYYN